MRFDLTQSRQNQLAEHIGNMVESKAKITSFDFLSQDEITALIQTVSTFDYRTARPVVGKGVIQDFDICFPAPNEGAFADLTLLLEAGCNALLDDHPDLFESKLTLNDRAVQKYPSNSKGIGIHRDGLRYRNLVFILTLAGQSRLFQCDTREGAGRVDIDDSPGRLVLLAAPGFQGLSAPEDRPFHGVDNIQSGRLSIGLRQEMIA